MKFGKIEDMILEPEVIKLAGEELSKVTAEIIDAQGAYTVEYLLHRAGSTILVGSIISLIFTFNGAYSWISYVMTVLSFLMSRFFLNMTEDSIKTICELHGKLTLVACEAAFEIYKSKNR